MIVFKITYDTSVVADFVPTFNSGYTYTTKTSTSGTLKTVTYESDTAFTTISIPNSNRNCVKSIYIDASGATKLENTFTDCHTMTDFTMVNASNKLTRLHQTTYNCAILSNITYENCDLSGATTIQNIFNGGAKDAVTNATFKNVKFNDTSKSMISLLGKATTMKIEDCDFSSITSCYNLFAGCVGLKGTFDLSMHDFTNVYETNRMFNGCANLTKIIMPKGTFDKITTCEAMFQNCTSLVEIDLSGFHIPNAQKISYMFGGCGSIEEIDCSALGVLNPTTINHMFVSCQKLKRVNLSGIKVPNLTSFSHMFYDSTVVEWIDISNVLVQASDTTNFWKSGAVVNNIGMLYCPANVINAFANNMVSNGNVCNIYYHDAKLEDLTVDSRFNYIYCEEYHGDVVTTPNDLELYCNHHYDRNTKKSSPCYQDTLDLTTGTITRKNIKVRLNDCIAKYGRFGGALVTVNGGDMVRVDYEHTNSSTGIIPVHIDGEVIGTSATAGIVFSASQGGYDGRWYPTGDIEHAYTNTNTIYMFFNPSRFDGIDYTDSTTIKNWLIEQDFTLIIKIQNASVYTEQLPTSLNALKSYCNGSIQTSSQQLIPTLKTTLPISNKFTTTNLTSGSTYNVYFDGTATKLDAGGTIITNPVSPCEVECGGTTLTIEGADIQNVRVIETTVKNEVGSVCGTTDVELSRIKTKCELYNYFDDIVISQNIATTTEIDYEVSKMIVTPTSNTVAYNVSQVIALSGTYKFHCKVKMKSLTDKYKFMFGNTNMNTNDVTPTSLVEEINLVTYINTNTQAYFYALYANNPVEYYDISLIKLSDEDITGTDTSSINYSQTISKLEQPIKLRSLGTTYDSYNPVTGELVKRIGVSETDGSYSVLSSPIVISPKYKMLQDNNIILDSFPQTMNSAYIDFLPTQLLPNTTYTVFLDTTTAVGQLECGLIYNGDWYDGMKNFTVGVQSFVYTTDNQIDRFGGFRIRGWGSIINNLIMVQGEYSLDYYNPIIPPHLYTNGQVKVYSDSDVYPTTILNGQSTNNYEVNELNRYNNYTIRYEGECESINLNGKSNEQGANRIVKASTDGRGNLTFVNSNGDIDNVLLVQNDVREQEINHFTGLQTVEISRILIQNQNRSQYIDLPQPVQLNSLPDGTCDTYNPITGEYVQRVGTIQWDSSIVKWNKTYSFASLIGYSKLSHVEDWGNPSYKTLVNEYSMPSTLTAQNSISNNATMSREFNGGWSYWGAVEFGVGKLAIIIPREFPGGINEALQYLDENPIMVNYKRTEPTITQLTPITIPTFEGGIIQLITTDGKVFPMIEYSMPTNNRYDTSSWETGAVYTQRNMTEAYFNESTTPMTPTETMTLTTDHISSGSIILNDNGNGLIVLKGNYTGRDIPYFTGMRSVEAIEVETTPSPDQPLFGKGGRK